MSDRKQRARAAAISYWRNAGDGSGDYLCNGCSKPIRRDEGYLCYGFLTPDLLCEGCFDERPNAEPYELTAEPYFGPIKKQGKAKRPRKVTCPHCSARFSVDWLEEIYPPGSVIIIPPIECPSCKKSFKA